MAGRHRYFASLLAIAAASLALGGVILILALPRIAAEVVALPGNRVEAAIDHGTIPMDADLAILVDSRRRALRWLDSERFAAELALGQLLLTRHDIGGGARNRSRRDEAEHSLRAALALAPADPYAWTRLAAMSLVEGEPASQVVKMVEMALRTAPVEPRLTFARLELCFAEWDYFPAGARPVLDEQLRIAWRQSPALTVRLARATSRTEVLEAALPAGDRRELQRRLAQGD